MGKIVLFLPDDEMIGQAMQLLQNQEYFIDMIKRVETKLVVEEAKAAVTDGAEVIIARGNQAMYIKLYRVEPFRIAGNLYFIGNQDAASYLLDTEEGLIILDTGYPRTQALLLHSIASLGFRVQDIRIILHTHGHFDHIGCTSILKELSCGTTYLGRRDTEMFSRQPELSLKALSGCDYFTL